MVTLGQPVWLLLLIPLGFACWLWPMPNRLLQALRITAVVSLVLAMCQPAIKLPDRSGTVVVVVDRSESMPAGSQTRAKEAVDLIERAMSTRDQLGVVSFGHKAVVERAPQSGEFSGFSADVGAEASNLGEAVDSALALIASDAPGRILIVSDGRWTGSDPTAAAAKAAGRGVAIDHRFLSRTRSDDLAIQELHAPESVSPGEAYMITAWVRSPIAQTIEFRLANGNRVVASGKKELMSGLNRLLFRDRAMTPGTAQYEFTVESDTEDSVPENNLARALVGVRGAKPVLMLSNTGSKSGLLNLLSRGKVEVIGLEPSRVRWSLEQLSQFSAVLLENVMASDVGGPGMETISAWVELTGSGLMMTGGKKSYAPGGFFGSPLERILPVSMEMRREHRKLQLAIVVALDRSGSMAASVGGGKSKMDLANLGTAQVLDLLSPMDEIGVIAVDSSPHVIVPLNTVGVNQAERNTILSIDSRGGGIFVYEALKAASTMIMTAQAQTKHIILFSDARDSEQPGSYRELLQHCAAAGVTVSVIGLGQQTDVDAAFLEDIAKRGNGNIYFTDQPTELPRIFAQDTFTVARSTFIEESTQVRVTGGIHAVGGQSAWEPDPVGGYNLTYLRPEANMATVSVDEYEAPIVASWQAGSGRVICYTGEADGEWAGPIAKWKDAGDFYATLTRWAAGEQQALPDNMVLIQETRDGANHVQLHLDPEREKESFQGLPELRVLHGLPGATPSKLELEMQWRNADMLEAVVPIRGRETVLATVAIPGMKPQTLTPVCLPYSPEFAPDQPGRGRETLESISDTTGGSERLDLPGVWDTLVAQPQFIDIAVWLIIAGLLAFLLEIFQRRTGLLALATDSRGSAEPAKKSASEATPQTNESWLARLRPKLEQKAQANSPKPSTAKPEASAKTQPINRPKAAPEKTDPKKSGDNLSAMREAMNRAKRRRKD